VAWATSLKSVDPLFSARVRRWPITVKLVLLFVASTFLIVLVSELFLYRELNERVVRQERRFFTVKIDALRHVLATSSPLLPDLRPEVRSRRALAVTEYWIRIETPKGRLITTPGFDEVAPPRDRFPPPAGDTEPLPPALHWTSGQRQLAIETALATIGPRHERAVILALLDQTEERDLERDYRRRMVMILIIALLVSVPLAAWMVRSGLAPLEEMAATSDRITASRLNERIEATRWPPELQSLATAFDRMLERLEESFSRLQQFSSDLAHELRTPLNNLMGGMEVTLTKQRDPDEYRQVLESSLEEVDRLARMIDNLLFLARAERSERKADVRLLDATTEIAAVADFFEAFAEQKGVVIRAEGEGQVFADAMLLRRVLTNLVSNSIEATQPGGSITIAAQPGADGRGEIKVIDTGKGVSAEHLPRLFDRFYRVDPSRADHREGTGLGLAIVRSIMELHGGTVTIDSDPSYGTTVSLIFPPKRKSEG
jgi:two-component system heavy metal sensor histidine kinase CusS